MKLERIDAERNINRDGVKLIAFSVNGGKYTVTEECGGFRIHKHNASDSDRLSILPCASNEIIIR